MPRPIPGIHCTKYEDMAGQIPVDSALDCRGTDDTLTQRIVEPFDGIGLITLSTNRAGASLSVTCCRLAISVR